MSRQAIRPRSAGAGAGTLAMVGFLLLYLVAVVLWRVPGWVGGLYLAASGLSFTVYAVDKSAARAGRRRVPERTLLLIGLAGGWPGAIVAQQVLRHKTCKPGFRFLFWASVWLNALAFIALIALVSPRLALPALLGA